VNLLKNKNFMLLWMTSIVSTFCLQISWISESWFAINALHREREYGYILISAMLPRLMFMFVGGVIADNFSRKYVISSSLALRALLLLGLGLLMSSQLASFAVLIVLAFLYGIIDAYYWPSRDAILTDAVARDDLTRANSWMLVTSQAGMIIGPAAGGILAANISFSAIFYLLGGILGLSILLFFFAFDAASTVAVTRKRTGLQLTKFRDELTEGIRYVKGHPQLSVLMLVFAVANVLYMGPFQQSIPLLAKTQLSGGAAVFGNLWASFGIGMCAGGIIMSIVAPIRKRFQIVVYTLVVQSLLLSGLALIHSLLSGIVVMFLIGICVAFNNVPTTGMLQTYTDKEKLGRVMGFNDTLTMGLVPLSYLLVSGLFMLGINHQPVLIVAGILMFAFCAFALKRYPVILATD
jgi:DHA3 family macrolide efflux protein-like MFS transporter